MQSFEEEKAIEEKALQFARANKKSIAKKYTDKNVYCAEENPVSVFMAGSPGAGKTEVSKEFLNQIGQTDCPTIRIDPDDLRGEFEDYTGDNSHLFQRAVAVLVEKIHDKVLDQKQSFLLDGTLSNFEKADQNISRSLNKRRLVQILYVYQEPRLAWAFVQAREKAEGRRILVEDFINQYFAARSNVNQLKKKYGKQIQVDLLLKNIDNSHRSYEANIDIIDNHVPEKYTPASLAELLGANIWIKV